MEVNELDNLDFFEDEDNNISGTQNLNSDDDDFGNGTPDPFDPDNNDDGNGDEDDDDKSTSDNNLVALYLQSKGINPASVKVENENGELEEVNFNDLPLEDQLEILKYNPNEQEEPELMEDEEKLLTILRSNNMSVQEYLGAYRKHVISQYQAQLDAQEEPSYSVDEYSNEELFIADLKAKVPDLTEEDALQALDIEKQNPELFEKKMAGIRAQYEQREESMRNYQAQQELYAQQQQAAQFEQIIVDAILNNNSIDLGDTSLELSEDDMNEIASFILDSDAAGVRHIAKALNDPKMLVEMAWWALKGHEALDQVTQYYKKQIAEARRSAKASVSFPAPKPKTVVTPKHKQSEGKSKTQVTNEFDLYDNLI